MRFLKICLIFSAVTFSLPFMEAQTASQVAAVTESAGLPTGISFPGKGSVFVLAAQGKLVQLHASEIVSNSHAAGNFARSAVYAGPHASVELQGLEASVAVTDPHTAFYVRINSEDPELLRQRVHLIKMAQTKDRRVVVSYSQNIFGGQRTKKFNDIAVTKTDAEPDVWLKVTPQAPLEPGEYGIVFMPKDAGLAPGEVYDFTLKSDTAKPGEEVNSAKT